MLQASLDAIIVIDETGKIIEFNPAAEKMFGFPSADVIGKDLLETIIPEYYRKGYRQRRRVHDRARRADGRPAAWRR